MDVIVLIGSSGTGKSYNAIMVAKEMNIEYIIDDGLLIKGTSIIAGKSAKRENTIVSAVKRAIFMDKKHRNEVKDAIERLKPDKILILGTSEKMIKKIVKALELPDIEQTIFIEDVSSKDEMRLARKQRVTEGKHVIPVPTFEIKKDFSGYFIDTLRILRKEHDGDEIYFEKTVVRPTFSYLGKYAISNKVIKELIRHAGTKMSDIIKLYNIYIKTTEQGLIIKFDVSIKYNGSIIKMIEKLQRLVILEIEQMTAINIIAVDVNVRKITKNTK